MSEPALGARDARSIDAIAGSKLGDGLGQIVTHGAVRKPERPGDRFARSAITREAQHLALAIRERVWLAERLGSQLGIDDALAAMHAAHRVRELARRTVFQQITLRARIDRATQIAGTRECRHDD